MSDESKDVQDVWADSYTLMCLEAFDRKAERRLLKTLKHAPGRLTPEQWRESFEREFAILEEHPAAIVSLWEEQRSGDPDLTPEIFAERNRREIFSDILY